MGPPSKNCYTVVSIIVSIEMRKSSAKGVVTSCPIRELEDHEQWQLVDPFDITTGARLLHSNNLSNDDDVNDNVINDDDISDAEDIANDDVNDNVRKRKLPTTSPRIKRKRKKQH